MKGRRQSGQKGVRRARDDRARLTHGLFEEQQAKELAMERFVKAMLIALGFFLLIPPWGFFAYPYAIRIVQEYERGVIFRLGRLMGARGPGLFFIIPVVERMVKVDLRIVTMDVPSQECITRDNVTVKVNAVIYFRVVDPEASVVKVLDHFRATSQIAQTTLRSVLGQSDLDELLSKREDINTRLQKIIDEQTEPWGVKVTVVEVKDVELPQGMQRAMARQAEAERERRAKVINAEGEFQAAERLAEAGRIMAATPTTIQLRFLQTLVEVASERNSTIVLPVPVDLLRIVMDRAGALIPAPAAGAATGAADLPASGAPPAVESAEESEEKEPEES
jgi:regulator of protease activity HflC (stomatin/prohibitin superfamily)